VQRSGVCTTRVLLPESQRIDQMFLFFSNRLGCLVSLLISTAVTILLILLFAR
jgi:hypothetical protein